MTQWQSGDAATNVVKLSELVKELNRVIGSLAHDGLEVTVEINEIKLIGAGVSQPVLSAVVKKVIGKT